MGVLYLWMQIRVSSGRKEMDPSVQMGSTFAEKNHLSARTRDLSVQKESDKREGRREMRKEKEEGRRSIPKMN
jgi:hypothetical protein